MLFDSSAVIADPYLERHKRHSLIDILVIALCASICGAEGWEDIEEFGIAKHERFATFLELENGILSHNTFRRVFILLYAEELKTSYLEWIKTLTKTLRVIIGHTFSLFHKVQIRRKKNIIALSFCNYFYIV
jgi:hypothetical protein